MSEDEEEACPPGTTDEDATSDSWTTCVDCATPLECDAAQRCDIYGF